jgi:cytochrome c-type biogenesis protein CcmF
VAAVGRCALLLTLVAAVWGLVAASLGRQRPSLAESAWRSLLATPAGLVGAAVALVTALLTHDFSVRYVAETSDRSMPAYLTVLALWAGDAGSMLLWVLILALFGALAATRLRRSAGGDVVLVTIAAVQVFYLLVTVIANPFASSVHIPPDGQGMQPLLRSNLLMAVHPPLLYAGLIGFTVPFAIAMAALIRPELVDWWIKAARRWLLAAWCLLTAGLGLGALWSYNVLGWGGYWAWDPVENAAIMPWLTATALLHSARLQERRGVLVDWNLALMAMTFALTVLAAFLTRGDVLTSVHAFADSEVTPLYLGFLIVVVVASAVLIARRAWWPRRAGRVATVASRETALLGNNLALLALVMTILAGTLYPLLVRAISGRSASIGASFYRSAAVPLLIAVLVLAGIGPLLRWRHDTLHAVVRRAAPAMLVTTLVSAVVLRGHPEPSVSGAVIAATFVGAANLTELIRSGLWGRRVRPADMRQWRGALLAHVGLALVALGVAVSAGFSVESEVTLAPGQEVQLARYHLVYDRLRPARGRDYRALVAQVNVVRDGRRVTLLAPALVSYPGATAPTGVPAVHRTTQEDVYLALLAVEQPAARITLQAYVKPALNLVWVGCAVVASGGLLAAWPPGARHGRQAPPLSADTADIPAGTPEIRRDE